MQAQLIVGVKDAEVDGVEAQLVVGVMDAEVDDVKAQLVAGVKDVQRHDAMVEKRYPPQHFLVDRILSLRRRNAMFSL